MFSIDNLRDDFRTILKKKKKKKKRKPFYHKTLLKSNFVFPNFIMTAFKNITIVQAFIKEY